MGFLLHGETFRFMEKKLSTSGPLRESADKHSIYQVGQKPVTAEMIEGVLAQDINGLESTLTRSGYNLKVVAELVNVRPTDIRSFLQGRLSASRAQELRDEMLAVGIPL
jgi:hypothetical protein